MTTDITFEFLYHLFVLNVVLVVLMTFRLFIHSLYRVFHRHHDQVVRLVGADWSFSLVQTLRQVAKFASWAVWETPSWVCNLFFALQIHNDLNRLADVVEDLEARSLVQFVALFFQNLIFDRFKLNTQKFNKTPISCNKQRQLGNFIAKRSEHKDVGKSNNKYSYTPNSRHWTIEGFSKS